MHYAHRCRLKIVNLYSTGAESRPINILKKFAVWSRETKLRLAIDLAIDSAICKVAAELRDHVRGSPDERREEPR